MMKSTINLCLIAALDRQRAIGRDNALPWHLPDDLKRFKALTLGKPVLMGRKTAQSLGRALPGRQNLILTRSKQAPFANMQVVHSVEQAFNLARDLGEKEVYVIGGAQIYTLTLPYAQRLYLTHVNTTVESADTWFPKWDKTAWNITASLSHPKDEKHAFAFRFVDYQKITPLIS